MAFVGHHFRNEKLRIDTIFGVIKTPHKKKVRTSLGANNFIFKYIYNISIYNRLVGKFVSYSSILNLLQKTRY